MTTQPLDTQRCNLCGRNDAKVWATRFGLDLVKCKCGLIYVSPQPSEEALKELYSGEYFKENHYEDDPDRYVMYMREINDLLKKKNKGRFLDVGCGTGRFLELLPNFEKQGIEFSTEASNIARKKGLNVLTGDLKSYGLPIHHYDVVQLRGVLEHSLDPLGDLFRIHVCLRNDGLLKICQTPNIGSLCGRLYKGRFNGVKPKGEHLYQFTPQTLTRMLDRTGFRVIEMKFPYLETPYARPLKDLFDFVWNFITGKESPTFWGNMISLYAVKK
jgi:SAM-dependent methyltransferase